MSGATLKGMDTTAGDAQTSFELWHRGWIGWRRADPSNSSAGFPRVENELLRVIQSMASMGSAVRRQDPPLDLTKVHPSIVGGRTRVRDPAPSSYFGFAAGVACAALDAFALSSSSFFALYLARSWVCKALAALDPISS